MAKRRGRICEVCGKIYDATYGAQRTCGRACGATINPQSAAPWLRRERTKWPSWRIWSLNCHVCERIFTARRRNNPVCGADQCVDQWIRILRTREKRRQPKSRFCADCGTEVPSYRMKCDACITLTRKRKKSRERRKRRIATLGVATEIYSLAEVAQRDRHRCGLCGRKVNMKLVVPHAKAPTIDHIIPLAGGGDDTRANVQLAHFICNSIKGDRGGNEQLLLVG